MDTRFVLQVLKNENEMIKVNKGDFAYIFTPNPEDCTGWFSRTSLEHTQDVFKATFFKTRNKAKETAKKYGSWGVEYYIAKVKLELS